MEGAFMFPVTVGGKTRLLSQGLFLPVRAPPTPPYVPFPHSCLFSLIKSSLFSRRRERKNMKRQTWLVTVKRRRKKRSLVLSCQSCWHMKDWTLFKKKMRQKKQNHVKLREWNRVNSPSGVFDLYSCRSSNLLQKCNVVPNYSETFYKSNVNCTFFIQK